MKELLEWYNLVFVLPFLGGLGYVLLLATGSVSSDHEVEVDGHIDAHVDAGHDVSHGVSHAGDGHGHDGHDSHHESFAAKVLSFVGFGKVPISLLLLSMCFVWGFTGWAGNTLLGPVFRYPALFFPLSFSIAALCSVIFGRYFAIVLGRFMPTTETYASKARDLVGQIGSVRYAVTSSEGVIQVRDKFRNLHEVSARVPPDTEPLPSGTNVLVIDYDTEKSVYVVKRNELAVVKTA